MDAAAIAERITRLEGEIDELSKEIREEKKKRDATADDTEKAIILDSAIKVLYSERAARSATRDHLLRLLAAPAPAPGKNTPSRPRRQCPPSTRELATPPARCRVP